LLDAASHPIPSSVSELFIPLFMKIC
jgi:hypothetical protein